MKVRGAAPDSRSAELAYLKKQFAQLAQAKRRAAAQWLFERAALKAEIAALKSVKPRKSTPNPMGTDTELERKKTRQAGNDRPRRRRSRVRPMPHK
jgi:hypothetical protein